MSFKNKIENWFLSKSNSYNFYKNQYEKNIANKNDSDPEVEREFNKLKEEFVLFKEETNEQMDAVIYLMRTLFVDYELNNPRNPLKNIQGLSHEFLLFISNICNENGFNWWLDYSNLLGAVRHGTFIPWDDEIDIGMMRKDYLEFIKIIDSEIKKYELEDILEVRHDRINKNDENSFGSLKILVKSSDELVLGILNVYPYDFMEKYSKKIKMQYFNFDLNLGFERYYDDLSLSFDQTPYIVSGIDKKIDSDELFIYKTERIFPLKEITFGENTYYCPNDEHHYLKKIYGDYLSLPNVISIPENVDKFRYYENNDELFGECIDRIKNANSKF